MTSQNFTTLEQNLSLSISNAHHASDELGVMVGIDRLRGETAEDFRARILDVFVRPGGGDNQSLTAGANRQLGFIFERALVLSLRSGVDLFSGPRVDVHSTGINLYSAWDVDGTSTLELSIDTFNDFQSDYHDYHARYIIEIADLINANSSTFEATISSSAYNYRMASNLVPSTSIRLGQSETAREKFHKLANDQLVPGSVVLSGNKFFDRKLVDMLDWTATVDFTGPTAENEYWVDLEQGIITFGDHPAGTSVGYMYSELPLTLYVAPIEFYEFTKADFQQTLSSTRVDAFGNIVTVQPSDKGTEWINQLYEEAKHFWGGSYSRSTPIAASSRSTDIIDSLETKDVNTSTYENVPGSNFVSLRNERTK